MGAAATVGFDTGFDSGPGFRESSGVFDSHRMPPATALPSKERLLQCPDVFAVLSQFTDERMAVRGSRCRVVGKQYIYHQGALIIEELGEAKEGKEVTKEGKHQGP